MAASEKAEADLKKLKNEKTREAVPGASRPKPKPRKPVGGLNMRSLIECTD